MKADTLEHARARMTAAQHDLIEQTAMEVLRLAAILDMMALAIELSGSRETTERALDGCAYLARQIAATLDAAVAPPSA